MGFNITLLPDNHSFTAEAGETIMEAAKKHGHNLTFPRKIVFQW